MSLSGSAGFGRRRGRRGTGPATPALPPVWSRSSCATTVQTRNAPPTRPRLCGSRVGAGTARRRRRSAWPPARTTAARHGCPGRSPSPAGRCARPGRCHRSGASPRPSPRSDAPDPATRRAPHGSGPNTAGCPTARRRCHPTGPGVVRTSPTGSPHPAGARSRSCPAPHPATRFAVRTQLALAELADERRIRPVVAERDDLVEQRRRPQMTVIGEPGPQIGLEPVQRIRRRRRPPPGLAFAVEVGADRLAVAVEVTGDGRDRPSPLT